MKIAIIGNGNVGSGLANVLSKTQHEVGTFGRADDVANAVTEADIVILATPYGAAAEIADQADFTGKIVIDVSNPVTEEISRPCNSAPPRRPPRRSLRSFRERSS
ncbi:NAD(P)-binding domain-containing protein [Roseovarius sp. M141]|uniref:NAD(P)-binding domain-containing protein n=1 Tax=Roseovarius sp. M141 TaxID=2583806 RepID=UPI0020CCB4D8|nr:NAD(P)-binding domain-containing protein [Roseovarius sp. M141]